MKVDGLSVVHQVLEFRYARGQLPAEIVQEMKLILAGGTNVAVTFCAGKKPPFVTVSVYRTVPLEVTGAGLAVMLIVSLGALLMVTATFAAVVLPAASEPTAIR